MSCGINANLEGIKGKTEELNSLLQGGKDQLSAMQSKLGELQSQLNAFKPTIPEIPNLQKELLGLTDVSDPLGLATKIADIKSKFGSAVPDLDSKLSSLGLNSFPPSIDAEAICSQIPNVEIKPDGTTKEEPRESKPAEEVPPEPTEENNTAPVEKVELDPYELNAAFLKLTYQDMLQITSRKIKALSGWPTLGKTKAQQSFFDLTHPEFSAFIAEQGGSTFDDLKLRDYTLDNLRLRQQQLKAKYPDVSWEFTQLNSQFKDVFEVIRDIDPDKKAVTDFKTACKEWVERKLAKIQTSE